MSLTLLFFLVLIIEFVNLDIKSSFSLSDKEETNVFLYSEIESYVIELFRSFVNKSAVLIGIGIISIFLLTWGMDASWFFSTAMIFWLAWVLSTSVMRRFYIEFQKRQKKLNL